MYALTGGGREAVAKFEDIVATADLSNSATEKKARELLDKAAEATKELQARAYFKYWKTHLLWCERFEKGEWVDLTFDKNMTMWHMKRGTWTYESPTSVVSDAIPP